MKKEYKKHLPKILREFHYPKIILFLIAILAAYLLFKNPSVSSWTNNLELLSYLGVFIAGMLFSFGFTAPLAVGFFIILNPQNMVLTAIIGGLGSLVSDMIIFSLIRLSFMDEFTRLKNIGAIQKIQHSLDNYLSHKIRNYLLYVFAGIIIASPLPDEFGITMLAGLTHIRQKIFIIISAMLNFIGILIILLLSQ